MSTPARRRPRWVAIARVVLALALLWFVAGRLPWRDLLLAGEERFTGELAGDWKGERVELRLDPGQAPATGSPLAGTRLALALERGERVVLEPGRVLFADGAELALELGWRAGMPRAFRSLRPGGLAVGLSLYLLSTLFIVTRWWRILRVVGCELRWRAAFRMTYVGLFFNQIVPAGLNGGDVVRALLVVRENPGRRADALMSAVVDRAVGLLALILLAATVIVARGGALAELRLPALLAAAVALGAIAAYTSPPLRRLVRFERLLARLPQSPRLRKLDEALLKCARRPGEMGLAFGLSLGNHLCVAAAILAIGHAFGDELGLWAYVAIVSVGNFLSALPLSPGGWGVGELAYGALFELSGSAATLGVATSVTYRLLLVLVGLAGGLFLLLPGGRSVREELAEVAGEPSPEPR